MKLSDLIGPECRLTQGDADIAGISADSRQIKAGFLFAAMAGVNVDGSQFIKAAVENGAAAVLVDQHTDVADIGLPTVLADDPRLALAKMAARFHANQPKIIAAITGTAGKTSVATFLRQIWEHAGNEAAMIGTTGVFTRQRSDYGSLTTPDPVRLHELLDELASDGITHCSMEASSHGLDQRRLDGVRLAVAGFTNLGRDHLDYHPTVEDYLAAKMRLFSGLMNSGQPAVIYADDEYSAPAIEAAADAGLDVKTVGRDGKYLALKRVEQHRFSQVAEVEFKGKIHRLTLPMAGEFQLANGLVAAGMAIATGTPVAIAFAALETL
jgi:UDP-N-acetylmuramoyl-L-alanyl-D-glutamate--2,6-diaminopimelate ligase